MTFTTKELDIAIFFNNTPKNILLHTDQATGKGRGTGFVWFDSRDDLAEGLKLDGEMLNGRSVRLSVADGAGRGDQRSGGKGDRQQGQQFRPYSDYMDFADVERGIKEKRLVTGELHTRKYGHSVAFVRNPLFVGGDVLVDGWTERNRALPGDIVVVQLNPEAEWRERQKMPTTEVGYPTPVRPGTGRDWKVDTQAAARAIKHALGDQVNSLAFTHPPKFDEDVQPTGTVVYILERRPAFLEKTVVARLIPDPKDKSAQIPTTEAAAAEAATPAVAAHAPPEEELDEDEDTGEVFMGFKGFMGEFQEEEAPEAPEAPVAAVAPEAPKGNRVLTLANQPKSNRLLKFRPDNEAFPYILVNESSLPENVEPSQRGRYLYLLKLAKWEKHSQYPHAVFEKFLGKLGSIEAETRAILSTHEVNAEDFSDEIYEEVNKPFQIPGADELKRMHRRDLRKEEFACTIDPVTAKDLDDALSCEQLPDGSFKVGVHIADVSHFVPVGSKTDEEAAQRCTTVYLVQKAIPMLPRILSEDYCSLNANQDKFAFSVIWRMNKDGEVLSEWFGKSVIHNYCRMAYHHAQSILEDTIDNNELNLGSNVRAEDKPRLWAKVKKSVKDLNAIASVLRKKRFENGCLRLQRGKMGFVFPKMSDSEGRDTRHDDMRFAPQDIFLYETQAANHLVEEFMLLANMRVAQKLVTWLPSQSLIRRHGGPMEKKIGPAVEVLEKHGYKINTQTGPAMAACIEKLGNDRKAMVVKLIMTYCMQLAKYCCSDDNEGLGLHHFALNVPLYTHFTSPIRRYADVMVHRTLQFILELERNGEKPPPFDSLPLSVASAKDTLERMKGMSAVNLLANWTEAGENRQGREDFPYKSDEIDSICVLCNDKKYKAKKASDDSSNVFFCYYLKTLTTDRKSQPYLLAVGHVVALDYKKQTFNLFIPDYALDFQITTKEALQMQPWEDITFDGEAKSITITWKETGAVTMVELLTTFKLQIKYVEKQARMSFIIVCTEETEF